MKAPPSIDDATRAQIRAADPGVSTWVAANAGSGKTTVLTNRVARLLLARTPPARILCLTYTRAAAAEMQTRLFQRLGAWTMLDDAPLAEALSALQEEPFLATPERLAEARRLFAEALETPGGLKIQTLHAFCDALLRRFPLEAGVSPGFRVLDDRSARQLRDAVREALALRAERGEDPAFDLMAERMGGLALAGLTAAILGERDLFPEGVTRADLARVLGADPGWTESAAVARVLADCPPGMVAALRGGKAKDQTAAAALSAAAGSAGDLAGLEDAMLTAKGEPRSSNGFPSKDAQALLPGLAGAMADLTGRVLVEREARLAQAALDRAEVLHRFAGALIAACEARKAAAGLLDFDDLVARARRLLARSDLAAWVLWRLDGGIDHILVDEAQDTSPAQWDVITALTAEFLAGQGARDTPRTLFVVGDLKQSIYSFQGAEPRAFAEKRDWFAGRLAALGPGLAEGALLHSFRSAPAILRLVDLVFQGEAAEGLGGAVTHLAFHDRRPGRVELWPYLAAEQQPEPPEWWQPVDAVPPADPRRVLARVLAGEVAGWLSAGRPLPGRGRVIRPGDILILVQRRDILARSIIRELKARGVPVAGEDRLDLRREIAVQDILATLRFLATPADDLSLAAALRSPLFGVSEADLCRLANGRGERLLWQVLRDAGHPAARVLADLRDQSDYLRPHELIDRLLTRHGGRARLLARLGPEVEDGIDELLAQALAHEAAEVPGLTGFLGWIGADDIAVKREAEARGSLVRVMTVHGAKGLESPVVILPDTGPRRAGGRPAAVLGLDGVAVWPGPKDESPARIHAALAAEAQAAEEERRRLLYVALTRAESLAVICGAGSGEALAASWYGLVEAGMERAGATEGPAPAGLDGPCRVLSEGEEEEEAGGAQVPEAPAAPLPPLPVWVGQAPPPAPPSPPVITPSQLGGAHALAGDAGDETEVAKARGEAIHLLLERLPGVAPDRRAALAARLGAAAHLAEVEAVLAMPEAAELFAGLAEVPVSAALPGFGGALVEGRIDRLLIGPDRILAVDYKSNRLVPGDPAAVPEGLLRQMGAYQAALEAVFPGREVGTALLWTAAPRLMPLPRPLVLAALGRVLPIS